METKIEEIWKEIPLNPNLKISNTGSLIDVQKNITVPQKVNANGYLHATGLKVIGYGYVPISIHRLMLWAFYGVLTSRKMLCNHIDGNKINNNLSNLELVTPSQNIRHAYRTGLNPGAYSLCKKTEHYKKWKPNQRP